MEGSSNNNQLKGSLYVFLSSIFFGTYGIWARLISSSLDNFFQASARSLLILTIATPIAIWAKQIRPIRSKDVKWIALFTIAGAFTVAPIFYAYNVIGIGSATLLFYASLTIITYIAGMISFNEKLSLIKVVSLIFSLIGLLLIFNLSLATNSLLAALGAIIAGGAAGIEITYTKKVSGEYSPLQLSLVTYGVVFISHILLSALLGERWYFPSLSIPWLAVLGYSIASLSAFFLVVVGFKYSEPSIASIVGLMEIIFAVIFGVIFFAEALTTTLLLGCSLIIIAAALPNIQELYSLLFHKN